ncbi:MAG: DUF1707 domain-containing protein [Actinomycetota bacterium]|nr:DUF1707 domain-containing protein [Actinomycetota bacterium]
MARRATLRAADADREHVAERLRQATAEGRLLTVELEERLEAAFSARNYGELDALVADLPRPPARRPRRSISPWTVVAIALTLVLVVPVLLLLLAAVLFVVVPVAATIAFWVALCWWFFGHRGRSLPAYRRSYGSRGRLYMSRF